VFLIYTIHFKPHRKRIMNLCNLKLHN